VASSARHGSGSAADVERKLQAIANVFAVHGIHVGVAGVSDTVTVRVWCERQVVILVGWPGVVLKGYHGRAVIGAVGEAVLVVV
jgi:hypothetical protein